MGDFAADTQGLTKLAVDVEHLGNIATYLGTVSGAIKDDLLPAVYQANRLASTGGDDSRTALGEGIPVVSDLTTRIAGTYNAINTTLKALAEQLQKESDAITTIAGKYTAAEDRNHATATDFLSAVES